MVNIVVYYSSKDETDFDKLKSFKYRNFTPTVYGKINGKIYFVYGDYDNKVHETEPGTYQNEEALKYLMKKYIWTSELEDICTGFEKHLDNAYEVDIQVENTNKDRLTEFIKINTKNLSSGQSTREGETTLYLI